MNLKLLQGLKILCENSMVIQHSVKEILAKNNATGPMKYMVIIGIIKQKNVLKYHANLMTAVQR